MQPSELKHMVRTRPHFGEYEQTIPKIYTGNQLRDNAPEGLYEVVSVVPHDTFSLAKTPVGLFWVQHPQQGFMTPISDEMFLGLFARIG